MMDEGCQPPDIHARVEAKHETLESMR